MTDSSWTEGIRAVARHCRIKLPREGKPMTDERIKELRALDAAATPGPWLVHRFDDSPCGYINWQVQAEDAEASVLANIGEDECRTAKQTAQFIAMARTALPEALNEIERLRAVLKRCGRILGKIGIGDDELLDDIDAALAGKYGAP